VYLAAFKFCQRLPLALESVSDDKYNTACALLDSVGLPRLSKEEVLAKVFPELELSGDPPSPQPPSQQTSILIH
jgi:hypothetical protein